LAFRFCEVFSFIYNVLFLIHADFGGIADFTFVVVSNVVRELVLMFWFCGYFLCFNFFRSNKDYEKMLMSIVSSTDGKNIFVLQICFYQRGRVKFFWF